MPPCHSEEGPPPCHSEECHSPMASWGADSPLSFRGAHDEESKMLLRGSPLLRRVSHVARILDSERSEE